MILPWSDDARARAVRHLGQGGLIAFPTETVYGLAALPEHEARLFAAKGRDDGKPIARLAASMDGIPLDDPAARRLAEAHWPGPLTLVIDGVGYRVPDHPVALALLRAAGRPIPVTSANRSGEPEARSAVEAARFLGDEVLVIDGGDAPGGVPSTVVLVADPLVVLRRGAIVLDR